MIQLLSPRNSQSSFFNLGLRLFSEWPQTGWGKNEISPALSQDPAEHLKYCTHCVPQTYLWEHLVENRKERGIIRDLFSYISLPAGMHPSSACLDPALYISPCNMHESVKQHLSMQCWQAALLQSATWVPSLRRPPRPLQQEPVLFPKRQWHTLRPPAAPPNAVSRWEQEHPGPACRAGTPPPHPTHAGALGFWAEGGCSCLKQRWVQRWLEHFGFCIWAILTLQFRNRQLHFKRSCNCFSETSIQRGNPFNKARRRRRNKANAVGKVQGSDKFEHLGFSGFSCYLNRKLHCFRQSAHLQFFSLLSLCYREPHNVLPRHLLKCFWKLEELFEKGHSYSLCIKHACIFI